MPARGPGPSPQAAWQAVFHSVAAFANAGFSLLPDNLMRFRGDAAVNASLCKGCGTCVATCPSSAIVGNHFKDVQILAQIDALFAEG